MWTRLCLSSSGSVIDVVSQTAQSLARHTVRMVMAHGLASVVGPCVCVDLAVPESDWGRTVADGSGFASNTVGSSILSLFHQLVYIQCGGDS